MGLRAGLEAVERKPYFGPCRESNLCSSVVRAVETSVKDMKRAGENTTE
jgi:hypothetical protein